MTLRAFRPVLLPAVLAATCVLSSPAQAMAQGVITAAVSGSARAVDGTDVDGTRVTITNTATGVTTESVVRRGRFYVPGLEVGGPYVIALARLGFHPQRQEGLFLRLDQQLELRFVLQPAAIVLDSLHVGAISFDRINVHGGTATALSDSLLHRLPTLDRNTYDFALLAPQISTRTGPVQGMSAGGVGFRYNNYLINGVPQRGLGTGTEFARGRSVPFDAISEYQLLVAPFDVRYGDFAGAAVNAVTRAGTNQFRGAVFATARNDALSRRGSFADSIMPYERLQYGLSVGGPVLRDRAHFFVAGEVQHFTSPAPGPHVGQTPTASDPVAQTDLDRLDEILRGYGLVSGSAGPVQNRNPVRSFFGRVDVALPELRSRTTLWLNELRSTNIDFSRPARATFPLSTNIFTQSASVRTASLQLHTALGLAGGAHNELLISRTSNAGGMRHDVEQPLIRVTVASPAGGAVTIVTGAPRLHGAGTGGHTLKMRDNLSVSIGAAHVATLGVEVERFEADRNGLLNAPGAWTFSSLDSLAAGLPESFLLARDLGGVGIPVAGSQYTLYAGDQWRVSERVSVTLGMRAEVLAIHDQAPFNDAVDSIFARRTDERPARPVHLSPRLGFTWDVGGTGRDQVRGGLGIFTGRPPLGWLHAAVYAYGSGIGLLRCGPLAADFGPAPAFVPDYREAPDECANGVGIRAFSEVNLRAKQLRMAQTARAVLAYDRRLPAGMVGTLEALITRSISDFMFVNLNLDGPRGVDLNGRVLYGSIGATGLPTPALRSDFSEVIDLRNTSRNHSVQLSSRLEKRFSGGSAAMVHYTFSRVRDVQTPIRVYMTGTSNWGLRAVAHRHENLREGISLNDIPHRVVVAATQRAPWRRWATEVAIYYVAESGSPFTYLAWGAGRRGDLNADGAKNDPIYVPRSASDPAEIMFSGRSDVPGADNTAEAQAARVAVQQNAFERLVQRTPCLRRQRGRIMEHNSCREPTTHTAIASIRQSIPVGGRDLEAQLEIYNLLNAVNAEWGHVRVASPALLEHVSQTAGSAQTSQPIFRFSDTGSQWLALPVQSTAQLQLGLRYRF